MNSPVLRAQHSPHIYSLLASSKNHPDLCQNLRDSSDYIDTSLALASVTCVPNAIHCRNTSLYYRSFVSRANLFL